MFARQLVPYNQTNSFSKIVIDYLNSSEELKPFYSYLPTIEGIAQAIEHKKKQKVNRVVLVEELKKQYATVPVNAAVQQNIDLLRQENSFTVCTAHQPNLFTGPLYFMYKILHAVKLSAFLKEQFPENNFIPVYYMGSEDADFAELNHTYVKGKKIEWNKKQTGAVGRMLVDNSLLRLIDELQSQLYAEPHVAEVIELLKRCYTEGKNIQAATFELVNELYGDYGLVVLIPDNAILKRQMLPIFEEDIFQQTSSSIVARTSEALEQHYKVQANPREINLFYLKDNIRERIVRQDDKFLIHNTGISFTEDELKKELEEHPERFSPNVILRGLYQETLLPNIAFIGGGGELAYWLQLKNLFAHYSVPFPVLVLRNSFLIIEKEWTDVIKKLDLNVRDIFASEIQLLNLVIERQGRKPQLNGELTKVEQVYAQLDELAAGIDRTLSQHIAALKAKTIKQLQELEKKMMRAERKRNEIIQNKIASLKQALFPLNRLQERVENFSSFHTKWGREFIKQVYEHSLALEQQFIVLEERS
jgi:bacillithiol biosynthesis cysteine-adding enzyme BshC